jgi:hypothetical protein
MVAMERIPVPTHLDRLVNAVANIGYDPEVALCDLMDNSVDAGADKVVVHFERSVGEADTDTIIEYAIADDGSGMLVTLRYTPLDSSTGGV